ncbi:Protein phosphatase 2C [Streptosporangium canum]|uniref:Protein phosphatase 2C n=1 Tax=Streptosporangium canum TaxID=324952 RepID=A0A1I3XMG9_9ACTN|nr:protein phosphatase 2C domain-containing protein [Streptosporangium canum]SFK20196.1 Protein phosphatase 2C [Streptosporangium canum]
MQITYETVAAPGRPHNEDHVIGGPTWVAILDGATAAHGVDSGCIHDVPWLVARLAAALAHGLVTQPAVSLPDILAEAIKMTMAVHADTCDLANPDSPSSTVAVLRQRDETVDYLVLCDSPIALQRADGTLTVVDDDRTDHLPSGRPYSRELVRSLRNHSDGFWVASTNPQAAYEALTGSVPLATVTGALLLTDGVTRLVEAYGHSWEQLVATAAADGSGQLIAQVREAEVEYGPPYPAAKAHDDATAVWVDW